MIDSGADRDVISEVITEHLGLETTWTDLRVVTVDNETSSKRNLAKFSIESLEEDYHADVFDGLVGKILTGEADIPPHRHDISSMPHLAGITFQKSDEKVHLIIGAAHAKAWLPIETRRGGEKDTLLGLRCKFGWTVVGKHGKSHNTHVAINAISTDNEQQKETLDGTVHHKFAIFSEEEPGEPEANRSAIEQLAKGTYFDSNVKKHFVGLPWKPSREEIRKEFNTLDSRDMAMDPLGDPNVTCSYAKIPSYSRITKSSSLHAPRDVVAISGLARVARVIKKDNRIIEAIVMRSNGREIEKDRTKVVHLELDQTPSISNG